MTNEYRAQQTADLTARRDAWLAAHPNDTMYPITVACWMGSTYFAAWQLIDKVTPDGGMSTFDTVYVTQANLEHAMHDIIIEFGGVTWELRQSEYGGEGGLYFVEQGTNWTIGEHIIQPVVTRTKGHMGWIYPMECGWVWANQDDLRV